LQNCPDDFCGVYSSETADNPASATRYETEDRRKYYGIFLGFYKENNMI